jgi:hypothetical protein
MASDFQGYEFDDGIIEIGLRGESQAHLDEVNALFNIEPVTQMECTDGTTRNMTYHTMFCHPTLPFPKRVVIVMREVLDDE